MWTPWKVVPPLVPDERDELEPAVDLGDRAGADLPLAARRANHQEPKLSICGVAREVLASLLVLHLLHLDRAPTAECRDEVLLGEGALGVHHSPEVVAHVAPVRFERLSGRHRPRQDDLLVLRLCDPHAPERLPVLLLEGIEETRD